MAKRIAPLVILVCLTLTAFAQTLSKVYIRAGGRVVAVRNSQNSVQLYDVTHSGIDYHVGDSFTVTVKGPPNQTVTVAQNGGNPYNFGTTDSTGTWHTSGSWSVGNAGSYIQIWKVGGVQAAPVLSFTVKNP